MPTSCHTTWNGNTYNAAGTYKDTLTNAAGCDSIVTLTLTVNPAVTGSQTATICANQLPYIWNGNTYNAAGTYKDTLVNAAGCDSIVTLTLNVTPAVTGSQSATICANQLPYTWNGNSYNAAGTYKDTLANAAGCDSIVTLTLTVNPAVTGSQTATICANQLPYNWNGNTYTTAGTYKDTLVNARWLRLDRYPDPERKSSCYWFTNRYHLRPPVTIHLERKYIQLSRNL